MPAHPLPLTEHGCELFRAVRTTHEREAARRWARRPSARRRRRLRRRCFGTCVAIVGLFGFPLLVAAVLEWWLRFFQGRIAP